MNRATLIAIIALLSIYSCLPIGPAKSAECVPLAFQLEQLPPGSSHEEHSDPDVVVKALAMFAHATPFAEPPAADSVLLIQLPNNQAGLALVKDGAVCHRLLAGEMHWRAFFRMMRGEIA